MKERDFDELAGFLADVVVRGKNVKDAVKRYRQNFLEMDYCLPAKEAIPLAARILTTAFPCADFAGRMAEKLHKLI
jgi:hypothetical protein